MRSRPLGLVVSVLLVIAAPLALAAPRSGVERLQDTPEAGWRILLFTRTEGFRHDAIDDAEQAFVELGQEHGFGVDATQDSNAFADAQLARYRAVVFLLTTGDVLDGEHQAALERYIRAGGGYVGVHSASDTEYDWPWYGGLVGAYFASHPDVQPALLVVEDDAAGLPAVWQRIDEWYNFRSNPRELPELQVLASLAEASYVGGAMGDHPIAWRHAYDGGRAWYTGGGHTRESYAEPLFRQHLLSGVLYAAHAADSP